MENFKSSSAAPTQSKSAKPGKKKKPKWHEEYHHFTTSSGNLVAAGKNAKQNDELVAKQFGEADLFFHADIQGAPTTIVKDGKRLLALSASGDATARQSLLEAAQWAACYSSAWKTGASAVDVYAVGSEQVSKHAMGGYVGRGAFAIEGKREWFRATPLSLKIGAEGGEPSALPAVHSSQLQKQIIISPGKLEKEEAAKKLSGMLSVKMDSVIKLLPSGRHGI